MDISQPFEQREDTLLVDFQESQTYIIPGVNSGTSSTRSMTADRLVSMPVFVPFTMTFDRIICSVSSSAAGTGHMGIYKADKESKLIKPGDLVVDAGSYSHDSTGEKAIVIDETLTPGWYFLAISTSGAPTMDTPVSSRSTGLPLTSRNDDLASIFKNIYATNLNDGSDDLPDPHPDPSFLIINSYYVVCLRLA